MRVLDVSAVKTLRDYHHQQRSQPFKRARPHLPGKRRHVSSTVGRDTSLKLAPLYLSLLFCVSFLHFFFFTSTGSATYPTLPVLMCIFTILPLWGSVLYTDVFRSLVVSFRPESARLAASLSLCFVRTPPPPSPLVGHFRRFIVRLTFCSFLISVLSLLLCRFHLFILEQLFVKSVVRVS